DPQTTVADVAIQTWLAAPDMLRERHAEVFAFRQKNFLYYGGAQGKRRCAKMSRDWKLSASSSIADIGADLTRRSRFENRATSLPRLPIGNRSSVRRGD